MGQVSRARRGGASSCFRAMVSMVSQANDVEERCECGHKEKKQHEWAGLGKHGGRWGKTEGQARQIRGGLPCQGRELALPRDVSCSVTEAGLRFTSLDSPSCTIHLYHTFSHLCPGGFFFFFCCPSWENFCCTAFCLLVFFH